MIIIGYKTEFNWVLKLKPEQGLDEDKLKEGESYSFTKDEHRIYPIDIPVFLVNKDWVVLGKAEVKSSKTGEGKTEGTYKVVKLYDPAISKILTEEMRP